MDRRRSFAVTAWIAGAVLVPSGVAALGMEIVRVKPLHAIRKTLDHRGCVGGLPFLPEMERFAGHTFRVSEPARAERKVENYEDWLIASRYPGTCGMRQADSPGPAACWSTSESGVRI